MNEKILLIDDEAVIRNVCTETLTGSGYIVTTASSGEEGFQQLKEEPFDLVITDIKMPGLSGIELIEKIRKDISEDLPIIAITGHGTIDTAIETMRHGTQGFIVKPFTPSEIKTLIAQVIRKNLIIKENIKLKALLPVFEICRRMMSEIHIDPLIKLIAEEASKYTGAERTSLLLVDDDGTMNVSVSVGADFNKAADPIAKESIAHWVAANKRPLLLDRQLAEQEPFKQMLFNKEITSALCVPIILNDHCLGVLALSNIKKGQPFTDSDLELATILCGQAAAAIENARLYENSENMYFSTISSLASAIEARDRYTANHAQRIGSCSTLIAKEMGLDENYTRMLSAAGILHDIGKIGIPDQILLKNGRLTKGEYEVMKRHPEIGAEILDKLNGMDEIKTIIRHHHEHFDGGGYPDGLKGHAIALGSRIVSIVDAFEAMTSCRPYRKAMPVELALEELNRNAGTQFDPEVVAIFNKIFNEIGMQCMSNASLDGKLSANLR